VTWQRGTLNKILFIPYKENENIYIFYFLTWNEGLVGTHGDGYLRVRCLPVNEPFIGVARQ